MRTTKPIAWTLVGLILILEWSALAPAQSAPVSIDTVTNLGTYSIGTLQRELRASGGNGVYTWRVVGGSLPPGISLRTDKPSWFSPQASAGPIGVATAAGGYSFTLGVTSAGQPEVTRTFSMRVVNLVIHDSYTLPDAFQGVPYSHTLSANAGGIWAVHPTPLPAGLTLDRGGVFSGIPAVPGNYTLTFSFTSGTDTIYQGFSLQVSAIQILTPAALPNATQGQQYELTFNAAGAAPPYLGNATRRPGLTSFRSATGLPDGLNLSSAGLLSGVPSRAGTFDFSVTATSSDGRSYTKTFALNVIGVPPILPAITTRLVEVDDLTLGVTRSKRFSVSGGTAPYAWSVQNLPPGLSFKTTATPYWVGPYNADAPGASVDVTLTGNNFVPGATSIVIDGDSITVTNVNATSATVTATLIIDPAASLGDRKVAVMTPSGTSNTRIFIVITSVPAPILNAISPNAGAAGTAVNVTVTGMNFIPGLTSIVVSGTGVTVSNINATPTTVTAALRIEAAATVGYRQITVNVPAGPGNNTPLISNARTFRITPPSAAAVSAPAVVELQRPILNTISPNFGSPGQEVSVTLTRLKFSRSDC